MNKRSFFLAMALIACPLSILFARMPEWTDDTRYMKAVIHYTDYKGGTCKFDTLHNWSRVEAEAEYNKLCEIALTPLSEKYLISSDTMIALLTTNPYAYSVNYDVDIVCNDSVYQIARPINSTTVSTQKLSHTEYLDTLKSWDPMNADILGFGMMFETSVNWDIPKLERIACCSGRWNDLKYEISKIILEDGKITSFQTYSMEQAMIWGLCDAKISKK